MGGAAVGLILLKLWQAGDFSPRLRFVGAGIAIAGLATSLVAGDLVRRNYPAYAFAALLAPDSAIPKTEEDARRQSADLVARYPRDPRTQVLHAMTLMRANDPAGAEKALRAALAEEPLWRRVIFGGDIAERAHGLLVLVLLEQGRRDEAVVIAKGGCGPAAPSQVRAALDQQKLCNN